MVYRSRIYVFFCALLFSIPAYAQASADFSGAGGGSVIPGYDNQACGSGAPGGAIRYNSGSSCLEFCDGTSWICPSPSSATSGCEAVGDTCNDGTIFAGLSPDGQTKMYTTPADAPSTYTWNDGSFNHIDMPMTNCTDASPGTAATCQTGEANTAFLVGATSEPDYPFAAAEYCDGLSAHGHDDWYLPAQDELGMLYTNKNTGALDGTFNETGSFPAGWYWSSSEGLDDFARVQNFSDGTQTYDNKPVERAVRCVRR